MENNNEKKLLDINIKEESTSKLIIYDDDVNSIQWVIECIVKVLKYDVIRAEQITLIVHNNGKAIAKSGSLDLLKPFKQGLIDKGLSVVIE